MIFRRKPHLAHRLRHLPPHRNHLHPGSGGLALRNQLLHAVHYIDIESPAKRRIARHRHDGHPSSPSHIRATCFPCVKSLILRTRPSKISLPCVNCPVLRTAVRNDRRVSHRTGNAGTGLPLRDTARPFARRGGLGDGRTTLPVREHRSEHLRQRGGVRPYALRGLLSLAELRRSHELHRRSNLQRTAHRRDVILYLPERCHET